MSSPLLSICVPTYKRKKLVLKLLDELVRQMKRESDLVELVISVNPSDDKVEEIVKERFIQKNIIINVNSENIGGVNNLKKSVQLAKGKYIWIIGDDDIIIPEMISKVLRAFECHDDISWIHLNCAELSGSAEDDNSKIVTPIGTSLNYDGYYPDAKKILLKIGPKINGKLLFSSSNIYLRENAIRLIDLDLAKKHNEPHDLYFQLTATFASCISGGAYIFNEICIVQGQEISWSGTSNYVYVHAYNNAVNAATLFGYKKREVRRFICKRLTNYALYIWIIIIKNLITNPKIGFKDLGIYLKKYPILTFLMIVLSPIWIPFYFVRGVIKKAIRKNKLKKLCKMRKSLPLCIAERL